MCPLKGIISAFVWSDTGKPQKTDIFQPEAVLNHRPPNVNAMCHCCITSLNPHQ